MYRPKRSPIIANVRPSNRSSPMTALSLAVQEGLFLYSPISSDDGINDTQLLRSNTGEIVAVFKSATQVNDHDNGDSPRSSIDHSLTLHEQALREVAAHVIDRRNFFGVPLTGLVDIMYSGFHNGETVSENPTVRRKAGSLQQYIPSDGSAEDMSVSRFPTSAVHRLAILDIMLLNGDRHEGNVLVQKDPRGCKLIPIDHGYCLPRTLDKCWFCWLTWSQAKLPFGPEELQFIFSIDIEKDVRLLRRCGMTEDVLCNFRLACALLKRGAESGLSAFDIGAMLCRVKGANQESELEKVLAQSKHVISKMGGIQSDVISHMLVARGKSTVDRRRIHASSKSLLRDADDSQIAMSQYPLIKCGMNMRRSTSSPLVMRRI